MRIPQGQSLDKLLSGYVRKTITPPRIISSPDAPHRLWLAESNPFSEGVTHKNVFPYSFLPMLQ